MKLPRSNSSANLLKEQLARAEKMDAGGALTKDFTKLDKIIVGICGGDGIGPIITAGSPRVFWRSLFERMKLPRAKLSPAGHRRPYHRKQAGHKRKPCPADVLADIKACDVILKGPTTTPKGGTTGKRQRDIETGA